MSQAHAVVLNLWHGQGHHEAFWQHTITEFMQANPDVVINVDVLTRKALNPALTEAVLANQAPDMVLFQSDNLGLHSLFKLSVIPTDWVAATIPKSLRIFTSYQQKLLGIPLYYGNHMLLYYNKKWVSKPITHWHQLKQISLPDGVKPLGVNYRSSYTFVTFLLAFGGMPAVDKKITLNTEATIQTLLFFKQNLQQGIFNQACHYQCVSRDFFADKYAYAINGDWEYVNASRVMQNNLGIALLPSLNKAPMASFKSALVLAFPGYAAAGQKKEALKRFSMHLQSQRFAKKVYPATHSMPAHITVQKQLINNESDNFKVLAQQLELSIAMQPTVALVASWDSIRRGFTMFLDDKLNAEEAAAYMQRGAEYELKRLLQGDLNEK
ncbi:sugar ABC transporter substrate-binding protein [Algibacillus agarilyticus]|uniref:sugar ABC transporter substrate-binding protein n=1 Tax=Algibacillus agarilyticus TaxID=2234133 RepID=UPI0013008A6D|nr:extracellular solute-binding protein [Algibacillus agarilyticus]